MDGRYIEPRKTMWAVAELIWEDDQGASFRVPAILEDTSRSGACVRIKRPLAVGSRITVKWHREQFLAITRNCRSDGRDFLLGVRREPGMLPPAKAVTTREAKPHAGSKQTAESSAPVATPRGLPPAPTNRVESLQQPAPALSIRPSPVIASHLASPLQHSTHIQGTSRRPERKAMEPKTIFPHFWRRKQKEDAPAKSTNMEAPVNKPSTPEPTPSGPRGELLGYEDIYRAAGIMSPGSGYGIHKIVEMLNSERIGDLAKDVKRASVLMALDAAGISSDELLTDATRRQNALTVYEASQVKQVEDFEARKAKENSKIEEEMEKIRAHYAQRVQANLDQVAKEKDALRNWQMAMQHETQRIAEVIELCGKESAAAPKGNAMAAAAGAPGTEKPETAPAHVGNTSPVRSSLSGH
jgi:hypothetical protein